MSRAQSSIIGRGGFPPTRWSLVLAAKDHSDSALEALCKLYWAPLYGYIRRTGLAAHDAEDLTQGFLKLLLEKNWLQDAHREHGRLRTFLLTALKRFLMNERRRAAAAKRGGGIEPCQIDTEFAEDARAADPSQISPEEVFDRDWAITLLNLTTKRLENDWASAGKCAEFALLKDCLTTPHARIDYSSLAVRAGMTEGAARVAVHRMRKRFREAYREELAQTLPPGADLDEEMRHLAAALARSGV